MPDEEVNVIGGPRCSPDRDCHAPDETELDPILRSFPLRLSHDGQEFSVPHGRLSAFRCAKACPRSSACFMRWPAPCSRLATNVAPSPSNCRYRVTDRIMATDSPCRSSAITASALSAWLMISLRRLRASATPNVRIAMAHNMYIFITITVGLKSNPWPSC